MDFLDPKKRRSYNIRLFIGFVLIAVALILATTLLALITAGYTINRKTGEVIQDSLVFLNSQPVSANIYVNNVAMGTTNARLNLGSGNYTFTLVEHNYDNWTNNVTLYGGDVIQLIYPFLFPSHPKLTTISQLTSQPTIASSSPDRHWMLVSIPDQFGSFYNVDITNTKTPITTVTIPANILGNEPGQNTLTAVEWANDNAHVLLKDTYQGGAEYIMFDRTNPAESYNVNSDFPNTPFTSIQLDNKTYNQLYLYNQPTGVVNLADESSKTVTQLLTGALAFWPYGSDQILYTALDPKNPQLADAKLWNSNGPSTFTLKQLPVGSSYMLNVASFNGDLYVVIGSNSSSYAYIYKNPTAPTAGQTKYPTPETLLDVDSTPESVSFSDSARFIALQSGGQFAIYDIQEDEHYRYQTNLNFQPNELAQWMDGNRLYAVINNKLQIWDFDGTNQVTFTDASPAIVPAFNTGYDAVYTVVPAANSTTGQWSLVRNSLIANKP